MLTEKPMSENWEKHFARCARDYDQVSEVIKITRSWKTPTSQASNDEKIYFVRSGHKVKIGRTREVMKRVVSIKVHRPEGVELIGVIDNWDERETHKDLDHLLIAGEWFQYSLELLDYIVDHGGKVYKRQVD